MPGYGQFCPVAKAAEVLDQRWMLLVVRELVAGHDRFNDIHRGVPRMSRTLLSKRLKQLTSEGLVRRREVDGTPAYQLTAAGRELESVIEAMGQWGGRWIDSLADDDLDPAFLLWDMRRSVDRDALPEGETVLELSFSGLPDDLARWWLVLRRDEVEVCEDNHGFEVDVTVESPIRLFVRVWRGDIGWDDALRGDGMTLRGPSSLRRQVPDWLELSHFASVRRSTSVRR